jgi:hypothetical protein
MGHKTGLEFKAQALYLKGKVQIRPEGDLEHLVWNPQYIENMEVGFFNVLEKTVSENISPDLQFFIKGSEAGAPGNIPAIPTTAMSPWPLGAVAFLKSVISQLQLSTFLMVIKVFSHTTEWPLRRFFLMGYQVDSNRLPSHLFGRFMRKTRGGSGGYGFTRPGESMRNYAPCHEFQNGL